MTTPTVEVLRGILGIEDPGHRHRELEIFVAERMPLYERYAVRLCRTNSAPISKHLEDVMGVVLESAWTVINDATEDPSLLDRTENWEAITFRRARWEVRKFLDRAVAPASGMTTARRRHRKVQEMRSKLRAELGREATDAEIIDAANQSLSHLKDAANQGMVITAADLQLATQVSDVDAALDSFTHVDFAEDYVIHPLEGRRIVEDVVNRCFEVDFTLGQAASIWMADVYTDGGAVAGTDTITHIGAELRLTANQVREYVSLIRRVALEILKEMGFGDADKKSSSA